MTPRLDLALTIGPIPGDPISDHELRQVWAEHRVRLLTGELAGSRPWVWWAFEPGVPDALRGDRPALVPVGDAEAARSAADQLERQRAAWLAENHGASGATIAQEANP